MESKIRVHAIESESIVDGPGIRMVVFTQGCPHKCKGCHNPQTHDFYGGHEVTVSSILNQYTENPLLRGITFSGGEPMCQAAPLATLGKRIKELGGSVITYTGYLYEELLEMAKVEASIGNLLSVTDWLIDGPYIEELRSLELEYRGSSNQRIIILNEEKGLL